MALNVLSKKAQLTVDLEVSDTGLGMDEAARQQLFDPLFTTKVTGRGLGMAAVIGIIRQHRGAIQVESQLGRRTLVQLYFARIGGERMSAEPTNAQRRCSPRTQTEFGSYYST
ncbi:MAG: ATP-binding protein [Candidatus Binatia bacterium]|nr:ATP-binding protein [Candidatus Binatia bacterium]